MQSETIGKLADALAKAQGEMRAVTKGRTARIASAKGNYSYNYADLADVIETARDVLAKHALAVVQTYDTTADGIFLATTLAHDSGEWMRSLLPVANPGGKPQELGSAMTYMRRYAYTAIIGMAAEEDDDGAAANNTPKRTAPPKRVEPPVDDAPPVEDDPRPDPPRNGVQAAIDFRDTYINAVKGAKEMQDIVALAQKNGPALTRLREKYPALIKDIEQAIAAREAEFGKNMLAAG